MKNQPPKIIRDNKKRGVWAETVFVARAAELGLQVGRPIAEAGPFDCVVGTSGKFVAVQVKCTIAKVHSAKGYVCTVKCNNKKYQPGDFDFLAAYVIPEDVWYIVPEEAIRGQGSICLCSPMPKYERYREAWDLLLREVAGVEESPLEPKAGSNGPPNGEFEETPMGTAITRMMSAFNFFRSSLEKGGR